MAEREVEQEIGPHHLGIVGAPGDEASVDDDSVGTGEGLEGRDDPVVDAVEFLVIDGQVTNKLLPLLKAEVAVLDRALAGKMFWSFVAQLKHRSKNVLVGH